MASITDRITTTTKAIRKIYNFNLKVTIFILTDCYPKVNKTFITKVATDVFNEIIDITDEPNDVFRHNMYRPRSLPLDEDRCCARTFYPEKHLENGRLKFMRDDMQNVFGDRCSKRRWQNEFCYQHHCHQKYGVWDGPYNGRLQKEQLRVCKEANTGMSFPAHMFTDDKSTVTDDADESVLVEDIVIDGVTYLIDNNDGAVYDQKSENQVGQYNTDTHKWIWGPWNKFEHEWTERKFTEFMFENAQTKLKN